MIYFKSRQAARDSKIKGSVIDLQANPIEGLTNINNRRWAKKISK